MLRRCHPTVADMRGLQTVQSILPQQPNDGELLQQILAVGGIFEIIGQIHSGAVKNLVFSIPPQKTGGYIVYLSVVGDVC
jgi:hypothetical protein